MPIAVNDAGDVVFLDDTGAWQPAKIAEHPQTKDRLAFDGKAWVKVPAPSKGVMGYADDVMRSIASGMTLEHADEIAAKMDELTGRGGSYAENLAREQARDKQISPLIAIPGQVGGAVASTMMAGPALAGMAVGKALPAALKFAGLGAAEGAVAGSGAAVPGERLEGAGKGALTGGLIGAAMPGVVQGVSALARGVKNAFSPQANVAADLGRAIARDDTTPEALMQRAEELQKLRPGVATLADAGGENVRGLVERVAQTPGGGRAKMVPALEARQQAQRERAATDLQSLTGTRQTAMEAIDETMAARAAAGKPLYDEAMNFNATQVPELVRAWDAATSTGWGRSILNSAGMRKTLQTEYGIKDPSLAPLMVQIDAWKKAVDDRIKDAPGTNLARVLSKMRDSVVEATDAANPAYARARQAWAGPSKFLDAIEAGKKITSNIAADDQAALLRKMTDSEREGYRIGAVSELVARMGRDPASLADMTKYLRSPEMRAKIAAIMPTPEAAQKWAMRLDFEVGASKLTSKALGNSATARRLAEVEDAQGIVGDLILDAFKSPTSVGLLAKIIGSSSKFVKDTLRSKADKLLAETLTGQGKDLPAILRKMQAARRRAGVLPIAGTTAGGTEAFVGGP